MNPGASATVTVSLNANANSFLITHAIGNVAFNNVTAGTTQNRQFDLYVGNGGFEAGSLTNWTYVGDPTLTFALAACLSLTLVAALLAHALSLIGVEVPPQLLSKTVATLVPERDSLTDPLPNG